MACSDWVLLSAVLTGTVTSLANGPRGTLIVSVSLIKTYKAGRLTITQVGETMSVRLVSQCRKCPLLRRGTHILDTLTQRTALLQAFDQTKYSSPSLIFPLSDRCQLHHHGSGGWPGPWNPGTWCIHCPVQSPTSQAIDEHQQPTLLTSCWPTPDNIILKTYTNPHVTCEIAALSQAQVGAFYPRF